MNAFNWREQPSELAPKMPDSFRKPSLKPRRFHEYQEATVSDATREADIAQTNREVEHHFALAQTVTDEALRVHHRDEARRLAAKARALIMGRSDAFVASLEQARGLV